MPTHEEQMCTNLVMLEFAGRKARGPDNSPALLLHGRLFSFPQKQLRVIVGSQICKMNVGNQGDAYKGQKIKMTNAELSKLPSPTPTRIFPQQGRGLCDPLPVWVSFATLQNNDSDLQDIPLEHSKMFHC